MERTGTNYPRSVLSIWSDRQSAEGKKQILVRREALLNQFPRAGSSKLTISSHLMGGQQFLG